MTGDAVGSSEWREAERLSTLSRYRILDTPPEPAFEDIVTLATDILAAPVALVNLIDADRQWFKARRGMPMQQTALDVSICARLLREPGLTVVPDLAQDERFRENPPVGDDGRLRFYAGVRLLTPEGVPLGMMCVLDTAPRPGGLTDQQRFALESLARQAMAQIELRRLASERADDLTTVRLPTVSEEVGTWSLDLLTDSLTWSDRTKEMFGLSADAVCSMTDFYAGLHLEDRDAVSSAFIASIDPARRTPYDVEFRTVGAHDGHVRWVAAKGRGLFDADGRCVRASGTVVDISARRLAEQRLHTSETLLAESEAKFRAVTDSIDQMVWSSRADGLYDFYNQRWYDYTGMTPGSTDEEAWTNLVHPDDRARIALAWEHSLSTGDAYRTEYRLQHRSGQYRWVLGRAQPVRDALGRVERWYGSCTEIEDMVQAREVLARSRRELEREVGRRTAERDQLWRSTQDLLLVMDAGGVFLAANPAWTTLLSWPTHHLVGSHYLDLVHPEDVQTSQACLEVAQQGELTCFENRYRHFDGGFRQISWRTSTHRGLVYASGRDVTEARRAAVTLAATQAQLRQSQKMEAVGRLTGGIAHDFNNMLSIVIGSLDMLERRLEPVQERERRYVGAALEGARRASKLTQRLLEFSRQQPLRPQPVEANGLIRGMLAVLQHSVGSGVVLDLILPDDVWSTHIDPDQLENALLNLAVNARDAMDGGGRLTIATRAVVLDADDVSLPHTVPPGHYVQIEVTDTGRGMTEAVMAKAFDPFFTTKDVGRGTGLGLSQVYGFVTQSGGYVTLSSEPDQGTTVALFLPRLEADETPA